MANTVSKSQFNVIALDEQLLSLRRKQRVWGMWISLAVGILLICFSSDLSRLLVPKDKYGGYSIEQVYQIITNLRIIGVLIFTLGLVDRVGLRWHGTSNSAV